MMSPEERIAALEAMSKGHDTAHDLRDREMERALVSISDQFKEGNSRFQVISSEVGEVKTELTEVHTLLKAHCEGTSQGPNGSKRRDIVIKIGAPMAFGGGLVSAILYLLDRFI